MGWIIDDWRARGFCEDTYDAIVDETDGRLLAIRHGVTLPIDPAKAKVRRISTRMERDIADDCCHPNRCPMAAGQERCCGNPMWCLEYTAEQHAALLETFIAGGRGCDRWA